MNNDRITEACAIVKQHGSCSARDVAQAMSLGGPHAGKHLTRAVSLGLLEINRANFPHQYRVAGSGHEWAGRAKRAILVRNVGMVELAVAARCNFVFNEGGV